MATIGSLSSEHVALAAVLLKCKPEGIGLEDYFSALRLSSTMPLASTTELFNGSILWHSLFRRAHRETLNMKAELIAMNAMQWDDTHDETAAERARKRKSNTQAPNKANTQSKRCKTGNFTPFEIIPDNIQLTEQHGDRSLLLRIMFGFARHPQGSPIQPDGLTHLICLACEAMFEGLESVVDTSVALQAPSEQPLLLNEICAAIQHIWTSIMLRLGTAPSTTSPHVDYDMILPQMCPIIERLLQRLHNYCLDEALECVKRTNKNKQTKTPSVASNPNRDLRRTELFDHNCKIVTRCLAYVMQKSNDLQVINEDAFQALAAVFLAHLGSSVSFKVFVDPDPGNVQGGLLPPRGLSDTICTDRRLAVQAAKLEAPYLIEILAALMRHQHQDNQLTERSEVLQNLQKSLLRGTFEERTESEPIRTDHNSDENDDLPFSQLIEDKEADEFLSQVWNILGWDIILDQAQAEFTNVA